MSATRPLENEIDQRLLWRSLIDASTSTTVYLTDSELIAWLMLLSQHNTVAIAHALGISQSYAWMLVHDAHRKVAQACGLGDRKLDLNRLRGKS